MGDGFIHKYFLSNASNRVNKWFHYFDIYERHLERFRGTSPVMIEIGVGSGGSARMWKSYLGEGSKIVGIDVNPECKTYETDGIEVFIGGQANTALLSQVFDKYPSVDIILDDGSHLGPDTIATFNYAYDKIKPTGLYFVEDTHACYWPHFGGGVKKAGTFMEFVKDKLDDINAFHTKGELPISAFTRYTDSICIYDSIVVFEKRPQGTRQAAITEGMPTTRAR